MAARKVVEEVVIDPDACVLNYGPPARFGWCTTHEKHFEMGGLCPGQRARYEHAKAEGTEGSALAAELLALDDEVAAGAHAPPEVYLPGVVES